MKLKELNYTYKLVNPYIKKTNLEFNYRLSNKYKSNIYFKREDQQIIRSFKIRGPFNKILRLNDIQKDNGIVCCSAGNHAQGIAYVSNYLDIKSTIFLPNLTPKQKINKIKYLNPKSNIRITNTDLDLSIKNAEIYAQNKNKIFIHPFDDKDIIIGNSTIAKEIYDEINPDIIISPIGGGGLISGLLIYNTLNKINTRIIGAQGETCPSMEISLLRKKRINYNIKNFFIDGATISKVGLENYKICKKYLKDVYITNLQNLCKNIIDIYNYEGIILEPAGALSISILDNIKDIIKDKTIVCILSGGNCGFERNQEIINYASNNDILEI